VTEKTTDPKPARETVNATEYSPEDAISGPEIPESEPTTLDFQNKFIKWLYTFFRCGQVIVTPMTLAYAGIFVSSKYELDDPNLSYPDATGVRSGVFPLLTSLWCLGFLIYRVIIGLRTVLYHKGWCLALELFTTLLLLLGVVDLTVFVVDRVQVSLI
jgi:hypothetical protein